MYEKAIKEEDFPALLKAHRRKQVVGLIEQLRMSGHDNLAEEVERAIERGSPLPGALPMRKSWRPLSFAELSSLETISQFNSARQYTRVTAGVRGRLLEMGLVEWDRNILHPAVITEKGRKVLKSRVKGACDRMAYEPWRCQTCGEEIGYGGRLLQRFFGCRFVSNCRTGNPMLSLRRLMEKTVENVHKVTEGWDS